MAKNVVITGGSGNLGRYIAQELKDDYNVLLFDQIRPDEYVHWGTQKSFVWDTDLPFVLGDLTSLEDCMRAIALAEADAVVHVGAISNRTEMYRGRLSQQRLPEDETMRVNTMGTYYVLDAARRLDVEQVVMASTLSVTGLHNRISGTPFEVEYLPIDEDYPLRPQSTYGLSKLLDEEILKAFSRGYGIQTVAFRLSGIYYPHRNNVTRGIVPEKKPASFSPFVYVDARDAARAFHLALEAEDLEPFEAFFLNTDTVLAEETQVVLERLYPELGDMVAGFEGYEMPVSIEKLRTKLGYEPKYSWRDIGLEEE